MAKRRLLALALTAAWLLAGCAGAPESPRQVSGAFVGFGKSGLVVADGDLKECDTAFVDSVVTFQDAAMEEVLRNLLGKPTGEVWHSDLRSLHAIYWRGEYWSDLQSPDGLRPEKTARWALAYDTVPQTLADLAWCDNLQWLELGAFPLPSLEPLSGLPQLEHLSFQQTSVDSARLEELALLPALTSLELDFRDLSVEGGAAGMDATADGAFLLPLADRLTCLCVEMPVTWDPQVLSQLTSLELLRLTAPTDLQFLAAMPNLKYLSLTQCQASDWSALGQARELRHVALTKCQGVGLADLTPLEHLEYLGLTVTELTPEQSRSEIIDALSSLSGLYVF